MVDFFNSLWNFCLIPFSASAFVTPVIMIPLVSLTFVFLLSLIRRLAGVSRG